MAKRIAKHTQEESLLELSATEISPFVARVMSWTFVVIICIVPLLQISSELSRGQRPQVLKLFAPFRDGARQVIGGRLAEAGRTARVGLTKQFIHGFEEELERASVTKSFVQPRMQTFITGEGGFGNDKGVVGRNGWLFYQPGIAWLGGPDIIGESHLRALAKKMIDKQRETDPHPDPRVAIRRFDEDLRKQGIRLVVLPAPDKAALQPGELTSRMTLSQPVAPPNNLGYTRFAEELRQSGVDLFDPAPDVVGPGQVRFLQQDTHWTPEFMDDVARRLAEHIAAVTPLPASTAASYRLEDESATRVGDLVDMLGLTRNQRLYQPQTIRIQKVIDNKTGKPLEPDPDADTLLLGDSYTNIYSQADMGWGSSAGLAEHLAYHLHRPVDVIALNGGGASGTRGELARPENAERLGHKKVVVYQFAVRDLLGENWKPMPVVTAKLPEAPPVPATTPKNPPAPPASPPGSNPPATRVSPGTSATETITTGKTEPPSAPADAPLIVVGEIVKASNIPRPGSLPYKDCLRFVMIRVEKIESGSYEDQDLVAVFQVMKDDELLPAAEYAVGDRFRMTLIRLNKAERQIRTMQRMDELDDLVHQPYYVMQESRL